MKIPGIDAKGIYKPIICNRCGETVLLKYFGTKYYDGGFSANYSFENWPEGWSHHDTTGTLCPDCEKIYHSTLQSFMDYREVKKDENSND